MTDEIKKIKKDYDIEFLAIKNGFKELSIRFDK